MFFAVLVIKTQPQGENVFKALMQMLSKHERNYL